MLVSLSHLELPPFVLLFSLASLVLPSVTRTVSAGCTQSVPAMKTIHPLFSPTLSTSVRRMPTVLRELDISFVLFLISSCREFPNGNRLGTDCLRSSLLLFTANSFLSSFSLHFLFLVPLQNQEGGTGQSPPFSSSISRSHYCRRVLSVTPSCYSIHTSLVLLTLATICFLSLSFLSVCCRVASSRG